MESSENLDSIKNFGAMLEESYRSELQNRK